MPESDLHLAVALDGAGWHPAADRVETRFAGSPTQVAGQLEQLRDATGADELIITTISHDHADRVRSDELLAGEWSQR
jgi:alkanesulfonate monooxygenase SsuD/methylene tetrahydromethanopterin reductase-like flavin-dependent oxidoreductase (luciferase family)